MAVTIEVTINGAAVRDTVEDRLLLSDYLRHVRGLHGTHVGCEQGACGACTVLLDGIPVRSCLLLAAQVDGHRLETVEGLGAPDALSPLQEAFYRFNALQCGFCTPGLLMTLTAFLRDHQTASDDEIREAISSHLCRCTGYLPIFQAVRSLLPAPAAKGEQPA
jgi:carbon-monoxide dehydrogenase small subunit